jgi:fructoselysine-6-P-deglycase FrlB-like protein
MSLPSQRPSGLALIEAEIRRQHADALASFAGAELPAARIAKSVRPSGRLLLVGMGASHFVNRIAEPVYRALGMDASAIVASEVLAQPLPDRARSAILTSQSGASGEILQLLARSSAQEARFGLTLDGESALARALPCLIGVGGVERGFAATRSLLISLALHAAVASALGQSAGSALAMLRSPPNPSVDEALTQLVTRKSFIFSGRGELAGLAECGALGLMELARIPALALEGGQFRHGPLEVLSHSIGVIVMRPAGTMALPAIALVQACAAAGTRPVVFDVSGEAPIPQALTISLPRMQGLAAAIAILPALQHLLVRIAKQRVDRVGEPLRSTKVTGPE